MKMLILMRHAKSNWDDAKMPDKERPLNKRGKKDAPRMGALLKARELIPQYVLCSSAVRSRQTVEVLMQTCPLPSIVEYRDELYAAEAAEIIDQVRQTPDVVEVLLVVAHNPGLEMLLQQLSAHITAFPTAAVACLSLPVTSWQEVTLETAGELLEMWRPRDLTEDIVEKPVKEVKEKKKEDKKDEKSSKEKEEAKRKDEKKHKDDKKDKDEKKDKKK